MATTKKIIQKNSERNIKGFKMVQQKISIEYKRKQKWKKEQKECKTKITHN